jgi:hypothetical protein
VVRGQQEIHGIAVLIDGTIRVAPLATDLHIGFSDPDRAARGLTERAQAFFDKKSRSISLLVALGIRQDGQKVLLAIENMGGESKAA